MNDEPTTPPLEGVPPQLFDVTLGAVQVVIQNHVGDGDVPPTSPVPSSDED